MVSHGSKGPSAPASMPNVAGKHTNDNAVSAATTG
jgi:hypothetical protein